MIQRGIIFTLISLGVIFSGCASTPKVKTRFVKQKQYRYSDDNNPREFRYRPVIGTKQADTRVMIDMGEWAKIWVKNYRNENKTFVASHSIVTMVREPGFIAGEDVPRGRRDTVSKTYGGRSFTLRSEDLIYDNSSYGNEDVNDEQVKDYMNNFEYSKKTKMVVPQKRANAIKHDKAIEDYMKQVKAEERAKKKAKEEAEKKEREEEKAKKAREKNEKSDAQYDSVEEYKNGSLK